MYYIPYANTFEGLSLTPLQWVATGVEYLCYRVDILLQRPGINYVWPKKKPFKYVLDASFLQWNKKGEIIYRSPDGVLQKVAVEKLVLWLNAFDAEAIIWPFAHQDAFKNRRCLIKKLDHEELYDENGVFAALSNRASEMGFAGAFYAPRQENILNPVYATDNQVLRPGCDCETCQAFLSRAYLHHLLEHTPLLAQRFLIVHNVRQMVLNIRLNVKNQ